MRKLDSPKDFTYICNSCGAEKPDNQFLQADERPELDREVCLKCLGVEA